MAAAIAIFTLGLLSGVALIALLRRRTRSLSPSPRDSVAVRLHAVRRSRVAAVEHRLMLLNVRPRHLHHRLSVTAAHYDRSAPLPIETPSKRCSHSAIGVATPWRDWRPFPRT